jgi:hypothetical protein
VCRLSPVIEFTKACDEVPTPVRRDLVVRLHEIAESLAALSATSQVRESVEVSTALVDVQGWRFEYRVELGGKRIVVQAVLFVGK